MEQINVLIACEETQVECRAWLDAGFNTFSCDLQKCSGNLPERHVMGDVLKILKTPATFNTQNGSLHKVEKWHLIIAHPPCTYLSAASNVFLYPNKQLDPGRYKLGMKAASFFMKFYNNQCHFIAIENPRPFRVFRLPPPTTKVNPFEFGHPWSKRTYYWLKNLPPLMATVICTNYKSWVYSTKGSVKRSKSFPNIAKAMVEQWSPIITKYYETN